MKRVHSSGFVACSPMNGSLCLPEVVRMAGSNGPFRLTGWAEGLSVRRVPVPQASSLHPALQPASQQHSSIPYACRYLAPVACTFMHPTSHPGCRVHRRALHARLSLAPSGVGDERQSGRANLSDGDMTSDLCDEGLVDSLRIRQSFPFVTIDTRQRCGRTRASSTAGHHPIACCRCWLLGGTRCCCWCWLSGHPAVKARSPQSQQTFMSS